MPKITFMGAGSSIFVKNIIGDAMLQPALQKSNIALYDIDAKRLKESVGMLNALNDNINAGRAKITGYLGVPQRKKALTGADYVINAIQVGGLKSTLIDFKIPAKYGVRQTIADTLGIGGIFRALRTIPVVLDFARDIEDVCPNAWFLNYVNPMAMITGALLHGTSVKTVGLCHSVQDCAMDLICALEMDKQVKDLRWTIAGINHMAWLLKVTDGQRDLYPEIKRRAAKVVANRSRKHPDVFKNQAMARQPGNDLWHKEPRFMRENNVIRLEIMRHFGHYVTESSEHNAEYTPYWIKNRFPKLVKDFNIPIDEYITRCYRGIKEWKQQSSEFVRNKKITHKSSCEFGAYIMNAIETDKPYRIHGNIINHGFIPNLPAKAIVEVPCLVDKNGVQGCYVGELPEQCAGLNRTNINVQLMTIQAALTRKKEAIYHAAYLDPHTAAELPLDSIRKMCDELIAAHKGMLPKYT